MRADPKAEEVAREKAEEIAAQLYAGNWGRIAGVDAIMDLFRAGEKAGLERAAAVVCGGCREGWAVRVAFGRLFQAPDKAVPMYEHAFPAEVLGAAGLWGQCDASAIRALLTPEPGDPQEREEPMTTDTHGRRS